MRAEESDDTPLEETTVLTEFATEDPVGTNISLLNTTVGPPKRPEESHTLPVYVFTVIFGLIFIIAPLLVRRGPNRSITRVCIMLSTVCCWIFWTTTYIVQMNPLLGPRLSNHSLAWIGHKWGHDAASLTAASMNDTEKTSETIFNETETRTPATDDTGLRKGGGDAVLDVIVGDDGPDPKVGSDTKTDPKDASDSDQIGPYFIDRNVPGPGS